jgi:tRNA-specific 2-thiouridylase
VGYTLGQRKGLGLASGPWYVAEVDPAKNRLCVDRAPALWRSTVRLRGVRLASDRASQGRIRLQVRHRHRSAAGILERFEGREAAVRLEEPVWAPAPGQAGVLYDESDERVLGGGWIAGSE